MLHELKTHRLPFGAVLRGDKTFEIRLNDRCFEVGDILYLREYDHITNEYTGSACYRRVRYILDGGYGLSENVVCMAIA